MTSLNNKIKLALDESRMLVLGTQLLLGFQFRSVFEPGFAELPWTSRTIQLLSLGLLFIAIALIMWPGPYHRLVWDGEDSEEVHAFTTHVMNIALLPFGFALSLAMFVVSRQVFGITGGIMTSGLTAVCALGFWYGLGAFSKYQRWDKTTTALEEKDQMSKTELFDKIEQALIETRVVLPGVQALLGFQFATILMQEFGQLPTSSKYLHFLSLMFIGLTIILLMTPAAYHRIVERGEATEHFHKIASVLLLAAMVTFPLGICGDLFVVLRKVTESIPTAIVGSAAALFLFYGLWFGFTFYQKQKKRLE